MAPGTEFARDFCAGIGPLQLGVVLVLFFFNEKMINQLISSNNYEYECVCIQNIVYFVCMNPCTVKGNKTHLSGAHIHLGGVLLLYFPCILSHYSDIRCAFWELNFECMRHSKGTIFKINERNLAMADDIVADYRSVVFTTYLVFFLQRKVYFFKGTHDYYKVWLTIT